MDFFLIFKGAVIGFSIAAPVGPIGVLVIRRTLSQGRVYGLLSGLGAASADAVYGLIAGLGLSYVTNFLVGQQFWLHLVGGTFLCYLGIKTYFSTVSENPARVQGRQLIGAFTSVFFLTLTNPITILSFLGVFAGLGLSNSDVSSSAAFVLGILIGSGFWWFILSFFVSHFKNVLKKKTLTWINRLSGLIIFGFGAYSILSLFR